MNSICRHLATDLDVYLQARIASPERIDGYWRLRSEDEIDFGSFDAVIISVPAAQSVDLLIQSPTLSAAANKTTMSSCWAVMVAIRKPLSLDFGDAFIQNSSLRWIARNSSKPGSTEVSEGWVLRATDDWSQDH